MIASGGTTSALNYGSIVTWGSSAYGMSAEFGSEATNEGTGTIETKRKEAHGMR